jgi:cell division protein FtsB
MRLGDTDSVVDATAFDERPWQELILPEDRSPQLHGTPAIRSSGNAPADDSGRRSLHAVLNGILVLLCVLLLLSQWSMWASSSGLPGLWSLQASVDAQREANARLKARNRALAAEVLDLKQGLEAVEEIARSEMGLVKRGEVFFQVLSDTGAAAESAE